MQDFIKEREKEFKEMKKFCHFHLSGKNKYWQAYQFRDIKNHIEQNGFERYKANDIEEVFFTNNMHFGAKIVMRLKTGGETCKAFNSVADMLSFIDGYNNAIFYSNN